MEMKISFPGGKKVNAEFNGMHVQTDQPAKYGGEGSAPSPFEYFLSSIGTCAGIFVLSFCQERKIPTEGLSILQRVEYIPNEAGKPVMDRIILEIQMPAGFPEKYHSAVVKVADQCAVKKTIMNPPKFEIRTVVR
ncbi:MAG TPA: OsmC family protein [Dissulfurispiraceae bacterium]|nr:OsmC family protein [Dissulfurispiraceae bacterium]